MSEDCIDEWWCDHCDKHTLQKCHYAGHERDSSNDRQECTICGWWSLGMFGKWFPPVDSDE